MPQTPELDKGRMLPTGRTGPSPRLARGSTALRRGVQRLLYSVEGPSDVLARAATGPSPCEGLRYGGPASYIPCRQRDAVRPAGRAMGVQPNSLRYASPTGTALLRWDCPRQPVVWTPPPPTWSKGRHVSNVHVGTSIALVQRPPCRSPAGLGSGKRRQAPPSKRGQRAGRASTPMGNPWILASDEAAFRSLS
jgi:hypothetical protein